MTNKKYQNLRLSPPHALYFDRYGEKFNLKTHKQTLESIIDQMYVSHPIPSVSEEVKTELQELRDTKKQLEEEIRELRLNYRLFMDAFTEQKELIESEYEELHLKRHEIDEIHQYFRDLKRDAGKRVAEIHKQEKIRREAMQVNTQRLHEIVKERLEAEQAKRNKRLYEQELQRRKEMIFTL